MKACSYCGRQNDDAVEACYECGTRFPAVEPPVGPEPPVISKTPAKVLLQPDLLDGLFDFSGTFHALDWRRALRLIDSRFDESQGYDAADEVLEAWVRHLQQDLGGAYAVSSSPAALLLSELPAEPAAWLLRYAERASEKIRDMLGPVAWSGGSMRHVILVFSDQDDYYEYISLFCPDGEQATSGGVCIHHGYPHIAMPWVDSATGISTLVHELTHDCVAHLTIPAWLNEALAQTMERALPPPSGSGYAYVGPVIWDELAHRHFEFWTEENIQRFWAGISFHEPGDPNELSYSLALVLFNLISEKAAGTSLQEFVLNARPEDAGQTAALDHLGLDLGDVAATFLGPGNWRPQRKAIRACWQRPGPPEPEPGADPQSESVRT